MPFDPNEYLNKKKAQGSSFDPDKYLQKKQAVPDAIAVTETTKPRDFTPDREIGGGESAFRGGIDSLTFGFGDEIGGAMEALGSLVGVRGIGSPDLKDVRRESDEEDKQSFSDVYRAMRDRRRGLDTEAEKQNPKSYMGGQFAGGVATLPLGGAGLKVASKIPQVAKAVNVAKAAPLPSKLAQSAILGAAEGGVYGAGASEGEGFDDVAFDAVKGMGLGAAGGAIMSKGGDIATKGVKSLGRLISKVNPNQKVVEVVSNLAFDLPPEYTKELLKRPNLKNIKTNEEIEDLLIDTAVRVKKDLSKEDAIAWNFLSDKKSVDTEVLKSRVNNLVKEMGLEMSDMPADVAAKRKLNSAISTLDNMGLGVSERDVKSLVQKLDKETDWNRMDLSVANEAMQRLRGDFDSLIKGNPAYASQMKKVQDLAQSLNMMETKFGFKPQGAGYRAEDLTSTKVKGLFDARGMPKRKKTIEGLEKINPELVDEIKMRQILDRTEGGVTQGSRNVLSGGVMGGVASGPLGMAAGAGLGFVKDKYGRKVGKELIDKGRDKILRRDELFQALGRKIEGAGQKAAQSMPAIQTGFTAATVPNFIADQLGKDMSDLDEVEKKSVTKIYLMKKNNPSMSEDDVKEYMKKSVPGYSQKQAADEFVNGKK